MPRIPISDIPNAPQPVAMPTGGNLSGVNLGRAQSLLQRETISPDAFQGPAKGMQALAQGVGSLSGAAQDISRAALHLQEQRDENQVWKAMDALNEKHGAIQADIASNPTDPAEYGPKMAKGLDDAYKQIISDSSISQTARAKIEQRYNRFRTDAVGQMQLTGAKTLFNQNKQHVTDYVTQKIEAGDTAQAVDVINGYRGTLFFEQEADGLIHHARQQGDVLRVQQLAKSDPDKADEMLNDKKQTPYIPETLRLRIADQNDTERRRIDAENWEALAQGISNRTIATPEDAAVIFGEKFATKYATRIKSIFAANPDMNRVREDYLRIDSEIGALDPKDPDIAKKGFDMRVQIYSALPEGFRKDALDSLNGKINSKPEASARAQLSDSLATAMAGGVFGQWNEKSLKKGDADEVAKKNSANAAMYRVKRDGEEWLRKNPSASPDQIQEWFKERMSREIKQAEPGMWANIKSFFGSSKKPTAAPTPAPIGSRIDDKLMNHSPKAAPAPTPAPAGSKVTSYGYSGDPNTDSNSRKGIGAWDNRLESGLSFAASPDVEKSLKESGIKGGDLVEVTLSNGETIKVRWDDRTADDKTAKRLGLNPLRGRWDIYSKDGLHPLDGIEVRSFQKAQA